MKVAVSIPDRIFDDAEALAKRFGASRSEIYARALDAFVGTHSPDRITEAMNQVMDSLDETDESLDEFVVRATQSVFRRTEW